MPHTLMVISPHGDDAAAFCGGTVAKHAALSWKVVMVVIADMGFLLSLHLQQTGPQV